MPSSSDIEAEVLAYVREARLNGGVPSRDGAIYYVTGVLPVMPSEVSRVIGQLFERGTLARGANDRLILKG